MTQGRNGSVVVPWGVFAAAEPDLAAVGERLLFQSGVGLAFLATVRADGSPRLHPLSPVLSGGRLYVFILPDSPKRLDLLHRGRFALQTPPRPGMDLLKEGEEFYVTGRAHPVDDLELRRAVLRDALQHVGESEVLFELLVDRVMHTT